MKKKMWIATPFTILAVIAMFVMSIFSFNYSKILFFIEFGIAVIFALSLFFMNAQFWFHNRFAVKTAKTVLLSENEDALNEMLMPAVVVGLESDIIWANNAFLKDICDAETCLGESINKYLYPKTLRQIVHNKKTNIEYKNKKFTVYTVKTSESYIVYFIDDTHYKNVQKEFAEKKSVVALISFDNKDELLRDASGGEESRIISEFEYYLRDWASQMNAVFKKLSGSHYLMITDEVHIDQARENKFDILNQIRQIKGTKELFATISVGIGRESSSIVESESWARRALEMALGRGGDQVVIIKKGNEFEFFGGISKGVERRDKVKSRVIATSLAEHIRNSDKVFIMGHKNSDLDSMGSAIGIWAAAHKALNKDAVIVVDKGKSLAVPLINSMVTAYPKEKIFLAPHEALQEITDRSLVVVVDTHAEYIVESPEIIKTAKNIVVIDHHRMVVNHIQNSIIFYHEPTASSASEMVTELIQYIDQKCLGVVESQALLSGIMLDTKYFVLKTGIRTFEASAFLKQRGADTVTIKKYFSNSMTTYKEKAKFVATADIYNGCAIACGISSGNATRIAAAQAADELLTIQGVNASFVLFKDEEQIIISARSLGEINVQVILEEFGGGGHLTMAGAQINGMSLEEGKSALLSVLQDKINGGK